MWKLWWNVMLSYCTSSISSILNSRFYDLLTVKILTWYTLCLWKAHKKLLRLTKFGSVAKIVLSLYLFRPSSLWSDDWIMIMRWSRSHSQYHRGRGDQKRHLSGEEESVHEDTEWSGQEDRESFIDLIIVHVHSLAYLYPVSKLIQISYLNRFTC